MNHFLFYDLETTGLNKAFDQILQFACIRTDMAFNELERASILIRLRKDVIYAPEAIITNRIAIEDTNQNGICEYEAVKHIHQLMNTPDTISIGYNSLGFDDEFLRFCFYRNLLPPYTHQYQNGCRRMDMLPIAVMYWLYKREVIEWPEINGKPTLKLEHLSAANELTHGRAHDALFDVEATVALARRFSKATETWRYIGGYFDKNEDRNRIKTLPAAFNGCAPDMHQKGLFIGSELGPKNAYQAPVLSLGNSIPYSNQRLWLRLDLPELTATTEDSIPDTTWVIRKKYGEPGIILPPKPRFWNRLEPTRREIAAANLNWIESHPDRFLQIIEYHRHFAYPDIPNVDLDAALYINGFLSPPEQALCQKFHEASLTGKIKIINDMPSPRTRALARRILWRNYADQLPHPLLDDYQSFLTTIFPSQVDQTPVDYKGERRRTPAETLARIEQIEKSASGLDTEQIALIGELKLYLKHRFENSAPSL